MERCGAKHGSYRSAGIKHPVKGGESVRISKSKEPRPDCCERIGFDLYVEITPPVSRHSLDTKIETYIP